jgi:hypothetical protein
LSFLRLEGALAILSNSKQMVLSAFYGLFAEVPLEDFSRHPVGKKGGAIQVKR